MLLKQHRLLIRKHQGHAVDVAWLVGCVKSVSGNRTLQMTFWKKWCRAKFLMTGADIAVDCQPEQQHIPKAGCHSIVPF